MKNSTKLKLALLKEFGHPQGPIEKNFDEEGENDVRFGNEKHHPHREEEEYGVCQECGVPAMYEGMCQECGYMEEGHHLEEEKHEVFMAQKNLETIIKSATELLHKLGDEEREVPAWLADHITKAETYIEQANDGFYFEDEEDGEEDTVYTSEEEPEHNDDMSLSNMMEKASKKKVDSFGYTKNGSAAGPFRGAQGPIINNNLEEKKPSAGLTKKQKSSIEKKAHKGKNVGHGGFDKLAKKAAKEYGSKEAGKRVAAAAMWKGIHRK
jgi:hypothetical protein